MTLVSLPLTLASLPQECIHLPIAFQIFAFMGFVVIGTYLVAKFKQKSFLLKYKNKTSQQLAIIETRALGNRQHLLVVAYQDQKFLLSASPNEIRYLCPLYSPNKNPKLE